MYRVIANSSVDDYKGQVDAYINENRDYHVDLMFGDISSADSRYQDIFRDLKVAGYKVRESNFKSMMYMSSAITIDVPQGTRDVPADIENIVNQYPNITIWDVAFHNAKTSRKMKIGLRDTYVSDLHKHM